MALSFTETDSTTGICGTGAPWCVGSGTDALVPRRCANGESAGSSEFTVGLTGDLAGQNAIQFACIVGESVSWDSGNWIVRINVTSENMFCTWSATYICRVNSSCTSQATIGSLTGQSTSLASTGVKTHTVSGSGQTPSAGDKVLAILLFDNSSMSGQNVGITPDQDIDSPFTAAVDESVFPTFGPFGQTGPRFDPPEIVGY